jgi:16S rRNA (adenine1518-N6/adenine1519-N6)-dimethyltransferase
VHKHKLRTKKKFGQHFLTNDAALLQLINAINPSENDHFVEIGPGRGALTDQLLASGCKHLDIIEIDRDLITLLENTYSQKNVTVINADATEVDFSQFKKTQKIRIVGNLPYNVSTPILFQVLKSADALVDLHFLLQKEVVDRLVAQPGDSQYSRLSVMVQYHCHTQHLFDLGPHVFSPPPKVDSSFVRLKPHQQKITLQSYAHFSDVVREAFNQRRKTLSNSLKHRFAADEIKKLGIDPKIRPQQCTVSEFILLANYAARRGTL